jgi:acetyl-CoA C-acetyltransferase
MGIGPVPGVRTVLEKVGIDWTDVDLLGITEVFAAQVLVCFREWKLTEADDERVNVNGSGIPLGHPIGATGGRIPGESAPRDGPAGTRYRVEMMCIGGGQRLAVPFERIPA